MLLKFRGWGGIGGMTTYLILNFVSYHSMKPSFNEDELEKNRRTGKGKPSV